MAKLSKKLPDSWSRVVLVSVSPTVEDGRWPIQRSVGEEVLVEAGVITDGHDRVAVELEWRYGSEESTTQPMILRWNDEYRASFLIERLGEYSYRVSAWLDRFGTWQDQFRRRVEGNVSADELAVELRDGARLARSSMPQADKSQRAEIEKLASQFEAGDIELALDTSATELIRTYASRDGLVQSDWYSVRVDPERARFAAWYEFFPRSASLEPGTHGTLDDAVDRLERIRDLGFNVVYLPPIHPIGTTYRKGKDNAPLATELDPGSPWGIGDKSGGHTAVHKDLGGMKAFKRFMSRAEELGLSVALDVAFQTSPDHPYVSKHPDWFQHRADGTIRYAENPPKKYQDVYPLNFESDDWKSLWIELRDVFVYWIQHGVRIFRVDNPHTKPFVFWKWCIGSLRETYPDTIFLAEAFARPKTMYTLAKLGFNNSYTYFTWRNTRDELVEYGKELFETEVREYFRPSFWPNTPDILTDYLTHGGRPAHIIRLVLSATMSSVYGVYGPPYEHLDNNQHPDREEYANNEKYEIRHWNWNDPNSLQPMMQRINRIRNANPALQHMRNISFQTTDNASLLAYTKVHGDNLILCVINLDPHNTQQGHVTLDLADLDIPHDSSYQVLDLLGGEHYQWHGASNFVSLNPHILPAHIFRIKTHTRSETDFEYFS